jgi:hypothetical protein
VGASIFQGEQFTIYLVNTYAAIATIERQRRTWPNLIPLGKAFPAFTFRAHGDSHFLPPMKPRQWLKDAQPISRMLAENSRFAFKLKNGIAASGLINYFDMLANTIHLTNIRSIP